MDRARAGSPWALDRGLTAANPCEKGGRLYRGSRADKIWTADDEARFLERRRHTCTCRCCSPCGPVSAKAICCGCRGQPTTAPTFGCGRSKTGARVVIRSARRSKPRSTRHRTHGPIILTSSDGKPWTPDGFRAIVAQGMQQAGIIGVTFNDLRGTAVTRLALVGCTEAEIATITGHSLRDVRSILDAHYLHRDPALGESAIRKLERGTKTPN